MSQYGQDLTIWEDTPQSTAQLSFQDVEGRIQKILGGRYVEFIPVSESVVSIEEEQFQSNTFKLTGYCNVPERYGTHDRKIWVINFADRLRMVIVYGKVSSRDLFECLPATIGGKDCRQTASLLYIWDSDSELREVDLKTGQQNLYQDAEANFDLFMNWARKKAGDRVGSHLIRR